MAVSYTYIQSKFFLGKIVGRHLVVLGCGPRINPIIPAAMFVRVILQI